MSSLTLSAVALTVKYVTGQVFTLLKRVCFAKTSLPEPGAPVKSMILGGRPPNRNSSSPAIPVFTAFMNIVPCVGIDDAKLYLF